jgi:hypothetical protein
MLHVVQVCDVRSRLGEGWMGGHVVDPLTADPDLTRMGFQAIEIVLAGAVEMALG